VRSRSIRRRPSRARVAAGLIALGSLAALLLLLSGCGAALRHVADDDARADVDVDSASRGSCATSVLQALGDVAERVYHEGIASERTRSATRMIESSAALRAAVEAERPNAVGAAARSLIATRHLTNLRVVRAGKVLADVGGPALAPISGTLTDASGRPLASFVTSVWADDGLIAETDGIAEATTLLRSDPASGRGVTLAGAFGLPGGKLPLAGTFTHAGAAYAFTSFDARSYPSGRPLRVFVLRTTASLRPLCGASAEETIFDTLTRIARLIYDGEDGERTVAQVRRVQHNQALLEAVARRDPQATRVAVEALLHEHIVRLRVSADGHVLDDDGGPYVLAPVRAPLFAHGKKIGSVLLSIQDDEGYKRLANRLVGLDVLMYMGEKLVKSTIGYSPGTVPTSGPFSYRGTRYRAYTFDAEAFPSGPLRITVLMALP
jgi:DNA-binding FadR family transcriptional regulator